MAQKAVPKYKAKPRTRVDQQGRIVIPAEIREKLGMTPGEPVSLRVVDGVLEVITVREAISRVQAIVRESVGETTGVVDDFIAERRREAERE